VLLFVSNQNKQFSMYEGSEGGLKTRQCVHYSIDLVFPSLSDRDQNQRAG